MDFKPRARKLQTSSTY